MDEKTCTECGETKPLSEYAKAKLGRLGRAAKCKTCKRGWYDRNQEQIKARARERYEANRDEILRKNREWRMANHDAVIERSREKYARNKNAILEQQRAAYWRDPEKFRERNRRYRQSWGDERRQEDVRRATEWAKANPEKRRAASLGWYRRNPHKQWEYKYLSRCAEFDLKPQVEDFTKADVIERYGDSCFYCETGEFEQLDHFVSVKSGGPHALDNVRPSCFPCNRAKSDLDPHEWLAEQAELNDLTEDELDDLIDAEIERWTK